MVTNKQTTCYTPLLPKGWLADEKSSLTDTLREKEAVRSTEVALRARVPTLRLEVGPSILVYWSANLVEFVLVALGVSW